MARNGFVGGASFHDNPAEFRTSQWRPEDAWAGAIAGRAGIVGGGVRLLESWDPLNNALSLGDSQERSERTLVVLANHWGIVGQNAVANIGRVGVQVIGFEFLVALDDGAFFVAEAAEAGIHFGFDAGYLRLPFLVDLRGGQGKGCHALQEEGVGFVAFGEAPEAGGFGTLGVDGFEAVHGAAVSRVAAVANELFGAGGEGGLRFRRAAGEVLHPLGK